MTEVPFADPDLDEIPAFLRAAPPAPTPAREGPVTLPPSGSGERARRRRQRRRLTWRRRSLLVVIAVMVIAAAILAGLHPWRGGASRSVSRPKAAAPAHMAPLASSAVLVQQDAQGAASSITLLVASPSGRGGHIVFVPPATMTEVPSFGLDAVGRGLALGGAPLFQVTLENLVGVPLPGITIVKDAQLTSFVQAAGPLAVEVPDRVEQTDGRGNVNILWEQGPATVAPADVPRFLSARARGNDLARLARHQSFWLAWLARVGRDQATVGALPPDMAKVVKTLAAGAVNYDTLPVEAVDAGTGGDEVYRVRQPDLDQLLRQLAPGQRLAARTRVQVLNGTGGIGVAVKAAQHLVPAGAQVVLSGNADSFAYAQTQIVFYDRAHQQLAAQVRQALGTGKLVLSRRPLDVVDVTVVIGRDFNG